MTLDEALNLVLDAADYYAGEYGFVMPKYCTDIFDAIEIVKKAYCED
jgi:hypothetical protein